MGTRGLTAQKIHEVIIYWLDAKLAANIDIYEFRTIVFKLTDIDA